METYQAVIIDDEPWTRRVIKSLGRWEEYGFSIAGEAADGKTGYELVHKLQPDLIITDVRMPGMTGIELLSTLRKEGSVAPFLVISGYDDYEYVHTAMKLQNTDYLLKPVRQSELNDQLRHAADVIRKQHEEDGVFLHAQVIDNEMDENVQHTVQRIEVSLRTLDDKKLTEEFEELKALPFLFSCSVSRLIGLYYILITPLQKEIVSKGFHMKDIFSDAVPSFVFRQDSSVEDLCSFLCDLYQRAAEQMKQLLKSRNRININDVCSYVREHYQENLSLELAAEQFLVSSEYLSREFKAQTGIGFSQYLTGVRMEQAKKLIEQSSVPLKEIGNLTGYNDQTYFYRIFRKYYGITPKEMRDKYKKCNKS